MFQWISRFLLRRKIERDILEEINTLKENSRSWSVCGKCGSREIARTHCEDWGHWHLHCLGFYCGHEWLLIDKAAEASRAQEKFNALVEGKGDLL